MKILIDIGHPAHVHLMKNLYLCLTKRNHKVVLSLKNNLFTAKELLDNYGIPYVSIGEKSNNLFTKALRQVYYNFRIRNLVVKHNIEVGIGTSVNLAQASKICRMKSIILDDDDDQVQPLFTYFAHPFCDVLLSPAALRGKRRKKNTVYYSGYHELAYLHPKRFAPDRSVLRKMGVSDNEKYFLLRFNAFKAHHDIGIKGLSLANKRKLIDLLRSYGRVFITTEEVIEKEFERYQIRIPAHEIHSAIYYAEMFIGDSQTMTSEAAVLGTPSIRSNSFVGKISYLEEEEHKYGLTYGFNEDNTENMFKKIKSLLDNPNLKEEWQKKRLKMLDDKIDVTAFLLWFVENYPSSFQICNNNPLYELKFK